MTPFDSEGAASVPGLQLKLDPATVRFIGRRLPEPAGAVVDLVVASEALPLPLRLDLRRHSPTGFEWGYEGSGPAQLALAMCAAIADDTTSLRVHQVVKSRLIASIPLSSVHWEIDGNRVRDAVISALASLK